MTKENAHLFLPLVQALANGQPLQIKSITGDCWRNMSNGVCFQYPAETYRIAPEPLIVPLGPDDVPPGSAIRSKSNPDAWWLVTMVTNEGVTLNGKNTTMFDGLMRTCEIKRPGEDWQACCKPALEGSISNP